MTGAGTAQPCKPEGAGWPSTRHAFTGRGSQLRRLLGTARGPQGPAGAHQACLICARLASAGPSHEPRAGRSESRAALCSRLGQGVGPTVAGLGWSLGQSPATAYCERFSTSKRQLRPGELPARPVITAPAGRRVFPNRSPPCPPRQRGPVLRNRRGSAG